MKKCAFFALLVFINLKLILFICRWSFKASTYISIRACYLCFSILTFKKICCIASTISQFFDCKDQIHDDDDDHNDDELFLWYHWPTKGNSPYFQPGPYCQRFLPSHISDTLWTENWTCTEPEFSFLEWSCTVVLTTVNRTMTFQM